MAKQSKPTKAQAELANDALPANAEKHLLADMREAAPCSVMLGQAEIIHPHRQPRTHSKKTVQACAHKGWLMRARHVFGGRRMPDWHVLTSSGLAALEAAEKANA